MGGVRTEQSTLFSPRGGISPLSPPPHNKVDQSHVQTKWYSGGRGRGEGRRGEGTFFAGGILVEPLDEVVHDCEARQQLVEGRGGGGIRGGGIGGIGDFGWRYDWGFDREAGRQVGSETVKVQSTVQIVNLSNRVQYLLITVHNAIMSNRESRTRNASQERKKRGKKRCRRDLHLDNCAGDIHIREEQRYSRFSIFFFLDEQPRRWRRRRRR